MTHDPLWEPKHLWYKGCVERSCQYPIGSFLYVFWWSLRDELSNADAIKLWATRPEDALQTWRDYFVFKWNQLADHRKQHGKVWGNE